MFHRLRHHPDVHGHYPPPDLDLPDQPAGEGENKKLVGPPPPGKPRVHSRASPAFPPLPNTLQLIPPPLDFVPLDRFEPASFVPTRLDEPSPQPQPLPHYVLHTMAMLHKELVDAQPTAEFYEEEFKRSGAYANDLTEILVRIERARVQMYIYTTLSQTQNPCTLNQFREAQEKHDYDFLLKQKKLVEGDTLRLTDLEKRALGPLLVALDWRHNELYAFALAVSDSAPGFTQLDNNNCQHILHHWQLPPPHMPEPVPADRMWPPHWAQLIQRRNMRE